ncbi:trimeric intracellular cation channel family protein [Xenophilus sp. Marseille-Q4582]|uniref:trimeric intracellular cation channel family protein n=1 Tax=Xenophilus sp. Marseille-Q4582 TaxID=2866600 RepID=UPI001CE4A142|nr:trimeric intracellular cation channel family protein [Xenophilus sp. Marseille-Q4582]
MTRVLYVLDLMGVAVFAVSGVLAAAQAGMDWLGALVLASVTAIGGGTMRDLLLGRHPIFWVRDARYPWVILLTAAATVTYVHEFVPPGMALLVADALGLALFAVTGAQIAESVRHSPLITVMVGTMTGSGGGVIRDLLSGQVPLMLRGGFYASAAIGGIALYLLVQAAGLPRRHAFFVGFAAVFGLRMAAILWDWHLPALSPPRASWSHP